MKKIVISGLFLMIFLVVSCNSKNNKEVSENGNIAENEIVQEPVSSVDPNSGISKNTLTEKTLSKE